MSCARISLPCISIAFCIVLAVMAVFAAGCGTANGDADVQSQLMDTGTPSADQLQRSVSFDPYNPPDWFKQGRYYFNELNVSKSGSDAIYDPNQFPYQSRANYKIRMAHTLFENPLVIHCEATDPAYPLDIGNMVFKLFNFQEWEWDDMQIGQAFGFPILIEFDPVTEFEPYIGTENSGYEGYALMDLSYDRPGVDQVSRLTVHWLRIGENIEPYAHASMDPVQGSAPMRVEFRFEDGLIQPSFDLDGEIALWEVDFGDGTPVWSREGSEIPEPLSHTYTVPDTYFVTLTVTDDGEIYDHQQNIKSDDFVQVVEVGMPESFGRGDWWTLAHDNNRTARATIQGPQTAPAEIWDSLLPEAEWRNVEIFGSPVYSANNKAFITFKALQFVDGAWNSSTSHYLMGIDLDDGTILDGWPVNLCESKPESEWSVSFSQPTLSDSGVVLIGRGTAWTSHPEDDGALLAYAPNGTKLWEFTTDLVVHASPAIGMGDCVYFGCVAADNKGGMFYALSLDGSLLWEEDLGIGIWATPVVIHDQLNGRDIILTSGFEYGTYLDPTMFMLENRLVGDTYTGNKLDTLNLPDATYETLCAADKENDQTVYLAAGSFRDPEVRLCAAEYDPGLNTLSMKWVLSLGPNSTHRGNEMVLHDTPGNNILSYARGDFLFTIEDFDTYGQIVSTKIAQTPFAGWTGLVVDSSGVLYAGSHDTLYAFDQPTIDFHELWTIDMLQAGYGELNGRFSDYGSYIGLTDLGQLLVSYMTLGDYRSLVLLDTQ